MNAIKRKAIREKRSSLSTNTIRKTDVPFFRNLSTARTEWGEMLGEEESRYGEQRRNSRHKRRHKEWQSKEENVIGIKEITQPKSSKGDNMKKRKDQEHKRLEEARFHVFLRLRWGTGTGGEKESPRSSSRGLFAPQVYNIFRTFKG